MYSYIVRGINLGVAKTVLQGVRITVQKFQAWPTFKVTEIKNFAIFQSSLPLFQHTFQLIH